MTLYTKELLLVDMRRISVHCTSSLSHLSMKWSTERIPQHITDTATSNILQVKLGGREGEGEREREREGGGGGGRGEKRRSGYRY